ncbi:4'-phosphopantetheinyl transferase family protein [Thermodesulfobacteriota bacterium]
MPPITISSSAPPEFTLEGNTVHVWCVSLDLPSSTASALYQTLSADELLRAKRFYFSEDRVRFVMCRGTLRSIIATYLGVDPEHLSFEYNEHGKPALAGAAAKSLIDFSVSHSRRLCLVAVAHNRRIGVDLEHLRPLHEMMQIAESFFSRREYSALRCLPCSLREEAFFKCWTRKEAFIKAKGDGLALPLDQFDVSLKSGGHIALLRTSWDPKEACRWSLMEINPGQGYIGAVAVEGRGLQTKFRQWSGSGQMRRDPFHRYRETLPRSAEPAHPCGKGPRCE